MRENGILVLACVALLALAASSADARPTCHGRRATIVGGAGSNALHGTGGRDVIVGGRDADRIDGRGGGDLICGGPGADQIRGGPGSDTLFGGPGDDGLYGGLQDDKLVGATGNDLLIGGPAYNALLGGPGDDYSRDGFTVDGGPGSDWLSFATNTFELRHYGLTLGEQENRRQRNLENVVGTRFIDTIYAGSAGATGTARGLGFEADPQFPTEGDQCIGFAVTQCGGPYALAGQPIVLVDPVPPDPGVTVIGGDASEHYSISRTSNGVRVEGPSGLAAGPGCSGTGGAISCGVPGHLGYVLAFGAGGDDTIRVDGSLGSTTDFIADGGEGADTIQGGAEDDQLDAGMETVIPGVNGPSLAEPSPDTLIGGGGDDALMGGNAGPDRLYGGPGSDQLATWNPCSGGLMDGGSGHAEIADFAFSAPVRARLSGWAISLVRGPGFPCAGPMRIARSTELLEGSRSDDVLIGDGRSNPLIVGHEGDDVIRGLGGNDHLLGEEGSDTLIGGGGSDRLDCGAGGGHARRDGQDPPAHGCH